MPEPEPQNVLIDQTVPTRVRREIGDFTTLVSQLSRSGNTVKSIDNVVAGNSFDLGDLISVRVAISRGNACDVELRREFNNAMDRIVANARPDERPELEQSSGKLKVPVNPAKMADCVLTRIGEQLKLRILDGTSPLDRVKTDHGAKIAVGGGQDSAAEIVPYGVDVTNRSGEADKEVAIYDYLLPDRPVVLKLPLRLAQLEADLDNITKTFDEQRKSRQQLHNTRLLELSADGKNESGTTAVQGQILTEAELDALKKISAAYKISAIVIPNGMELDRAGRIIMDSSQEARIESLPQIELTPQILSSGRGIGVNGQVRAIVLKRDLPPAETSAQEKPASLAKELGLRFDAAIGPDGQRVLARTRTREDKSRFEEISIPVGFPLSDNGELVSVPFGVRFDDGVARVQSLFTHAGSNLVASEGSLKFVTNGDPGNILTDLRPQMSGMKLGVDRAEELFGISAQNRTQYVVVVPSVTANAHFEGSTPNAIFHYMELLTRPGDQTVVTSHETFHRIDRQLALTEVLGPFDSAYRSIKQRYGDDKVASEQFFAKLDEETFRNIRRPAGAALVLGGHSGENVSEGFASFMNSLQHPSWEAAMRDQSAEFRVNYKSLLKGLNEQLQARVKAPNSTNAPTLTADAPILSLVADRLKVLEGLQ